MTPSDEIIRTTHLPQFGDVYFDLKNQYKILINIVKNSTLRVERWKWGNAASVKFATRGWRWTRAVERGNRSITFGQVLRTLREFAWPLSPRGTYTILPDEDMEIGGLSDFNSQLTKCPHGARMVDAPVRMFRHACPHLSTHLCPHMRRTRVSRTRASTMPLRNASIDIFHSYYALIIKIKKRHI